MVTISCQTCGASFEHEPILVCGLPRLSLAVCDHCDELRVREAEKARDEKILRERTERWIELCPPLYRTSDRARIAEPFTKAADEWTYSPQGLGLVGGAGKGKTRSAYLLLREQCLAGRSCRAVTSARLAALCVDQFSDHRGVKEESSREMDSLRRTDVLLIDDLGKSRMTERCEMELFDILETRTSHLRPTIWTANATGDQLLALMSPDRGEPILRRLAEFSRVVVA